ncbi:MAG: hypothetical protein EPO64_03050 [Nitrospirae bacterium]|nr:MAG: hypothetical protein EPO64_03050 [Nitrospirota bacterium]
MTTSVKAHLAQRINRLRAGLRHAFAIEPEGQPLSDEDVALLNKVATVIVNRRMADPAMLFLESAGPMNFLGSQALHFLAPILDLACDAREIERAAHLLERRDAIPRLIALIESKAASGKTEPR